MNNLMGLLPHTNQLTQDMMMVWADKHPYLYTLIQVSNPTMYVVVTVAGLKILGYFNRKHSERR